MHWDFRFEVDGHLIGYTIMDNPSVEKAPETIEEVKRLSESLVFKLKPEKGMGGQKCRVTSKARQPKEWLFWKEEWGPCSTMEFEKKWDKVEVGQVWEVQDLDSTVTDVELPVSLRTLESLPQVPLFLA